MLGEETYTVRKGMTVFIPANVPHQSFNRGKEDLVYYFVSPLRQVVLQSRGPGLGETAVGRVADNREIGLSTATADSHCLLFSW